MSQHVGSSGDREKSIQLVIKFSNFKPYAWCKNGNSLKVQLSLVSYVIIQIIFIYIEKHANIANTNQQNKRFTLK